MREVNALYVNGYSCWEFLLTDLLGLIGKMFAEKLLSAAVRMPPSQEYIGRDPSRQAPGKRPGIDRAAYPRRLHGHIGRGRGVRADHPGTHGGSGGGVKTPVYVLSPGKQFEYGPSEFSEPAGLRPAARWRIDIPSRLPMIPQDAPELRRREVGRGPKWRIRWGIHGGLSFKLD